MDPQKMIDDAAVYSDKTEADGSRKLRGYHLIGPDGQLVLGRPGCVYLEAEGTKVIVGGLKPGWKLGTAHDVKRKIAEGEALDKAAEKAAGKSESDAAKGIKHEAIPSK